MDYDHVGCCVLDAQSKGYICNDPGSVGVRSRDTGEIGHGAVVMARCHTQASR